MITTNIITPPQAIPPPSLPTLPSTEISIIIALLCFVVKQSVVQQTRMVHGLEIQHRELVELLTKDISDIKSELAELNTRMEKRR